jgi:folylpolyglutamate synthase/dihydropteroate synthase
LVDYFGIWQDALGLHLPLPGDYQLENAGVALAAYELAKRRLGWLRPARMHAIQLAKWPGRLELVEQDGVRVIIDGAHNDHAAKALAASLTALRAHSLEMVFGAMADKNIGAVLQALLPLARRIWLTRPDLPRASSLPMLRDKLAALDFSMIDVRMVPTVAEAVREAVMAAQTGDLAVSDVLVTGSLYTVAEARQYLLH